jgi:hypothetical protein
LAATVRRGEETLLAKEPTHIHRAEPKLD